MAGRPARHRQGHHALPRRGLAGDADERGRAAAAAGVRPRLGALQGREDEQVARHRRRSARRGRAVRPRSAAAVPGQGDRRSAATATSRGSASRSATTSTSPTTSATWSAASPAMAERIAADGWRRPARRGRLAAAARRDAGARTARRWTRFALHDGAAAAFRLVDAANEFIAETAAVGAGEGSRPTRERLDAGAVRRRRSGPRRRGAAAADHAGVGRRDSAPGRRDRRSGDAASRPRRRVARGRRARRS